MRTIINDVRKMLKEGNYRAMDLFDLSITVNKHLLENYYTDNTLRIDISPEEVDKNMIGFNKVEVAPNVKIRAYIINNINECHDHRGFWCYYPTYNRFYISINNIPVEGYIANIIPSGKMPYKMIEYDERRPSKNRHRFYHPPEIYGGSEHRNLTDKMVYNRDSRNEYEYKIGDKPYIHEDLNMASNRDLRFVKDIGAHWLMVSFLSTKKLIN